MQADVCEKVDIAHIVMERVDGIPSKAKVSSMEAANKVLDSWSDCAPESGYDQCDFRIVFEDGVRYQGHYKLNKSQKRSSLSRFVRKQLTELAKAKPATVARKQDELPVIDPLGDDIAESARIALDHYNI